MKTENRNSYNPKTLLYLLEKYGVTMRYVRQSIKGERTGLLSLKIREEYETIEASLVSSLDERKQDIK